MALNAVNNSNSNTGTAVVLEETLLRIDFNTYMHMHKDLQLGRRVQAQSTRPAAARHRCQRPRRVIAAGKPRRCGRAHQERQLPCGRDWRHRLPLVG